MTELPRGAAVAETPGFSAPAWDEAHRLAALRSYGILDTPPERDFDEVAQLAAQLCRAPIAVVNLIDQDRQFFKAEIGLGVRSTPLDVSICAHAILQPDLFVVPDTTRDPRFAANPLVTGVPHLRFYAGALLETAEGLPLGTLCVLDHRARPEGLTPEQAFGLQVLARQVMAQLELRRALTMRETSERRFRVLADAMPQMVWSTLPDGSHDYYNARWYEFTGVPFGSTDGAGWNGMFHPDDQPRAWARWRHSLESGEPYEIEYRLRRADGVYRWTLGRALPLRDAEGRIERWFGTCTDIEDIKATEDALRRSEERLRLALSAAEMVGTFIWDIPTDRIAADPGFARLFSIAPEALAAGVPMAALEPAVHPEDVPGLRARIRAALEGDEGGFEAEYRLLQSDGGLRWVVARGRCERDAAGQASQLRGVIMDITERKLAEEGQELLARELSHRIKNIFTVIGGMISLSSSGATPEVRGFAQALRRRLQALAVAHDYVRPDVAGAAPGGGTTLRGLLATLLAPYGGEESGRLRLAGDDVPVGVKAATSLALILHELATNAAKYGALSREAGHVAITLERRGDRLGLIWQERGGPEVAGPPERRGFGTILAERGSLQLGGRVAQDWEKGGLTLRLEVPLARLAG